VPHFHRKPVCKEEIKVTDVVRDRAAEDGVVGRLLMRAPTAEDARSEPVVVPPAGANAWRSAVVGAVLGFVSTTVLITIVGTIAGITIAGAFGVGVFVGGFGGIGFGFMMGGMTGLGTLVDGPRAQSVPAGK
jgi:hypothetical protein